MEFRDLNYEKDIPEVVDLIRKNLNPKYSEEVLVWKHMSSPFGRSASIVAVEEGEIVAVVFALRYNYRDREGNILRGIRTFDGCTDTSQRGKGIFKKIMKLCVDRFNNDYDFLMANPNPASYPEHIKLGYIEAEKNYSYKVGLLFPLGSLGDGKLLDFLKVPINSMDREAEENIISVQNNFLVGNTLEYLNWRYQQKNYIIKQYISNGITNYIVYRKETVKNLNCIILCDFYGDNNFLNEVIKLVCRKEKRFFIYFLDNVINQKINFLVTKKIKKAYIVFKLNNFRLPDNLVITLGDLEGRL